MEKWPRHKGIRRMREHVPLSRILKRATYPRFSRYFRPTIFRPFALSRRLSSAYFFSRVSKEWYNLYGIEYPDNLTALFRFVDEFSNKRVAISHSIIICSKFNEKDKDLLQERNYLCCHKSQSHERETATKAS